MNLSFILLLLKQIGCVVVKGVGQAVCLGTFLNEVVFSPTARQSSCQ